MRRRQLIMPLFICIVTIFLITKMVTAHAEDSTDESAYPTPTDIIDIIETELPTMTEYAYDESDPPTDPTETPTPTATTQPPDTDPTATTIVIDTNPTAEALPLFDATTAQDDLAMMTSIDTPTPVALASTISTRADTVRTCATHTIEVFEGVTTPNTMLEVRFDMRVVGGGMSTPSGRYLLPVYMGDEVSGSHTISIVKRYTGRLLQKVSCEIP
ncbi:MAG: hypothetical protein DWI54_05485 [Chloroflexi bacterium]|nr:MAG: hypothetical protein DWI54_05485 [Chloroflexota bacterium]